MHPTTGRELPSTDGYRHSVSAVVVRVVARRDAGQLVTLLRLVGVEAAGGRGADTRGKLIKVIDHSCS